MLNRSTHKASVRRAFTAMEIQLLQILANKAPIPFSGTHPTHF
jgi:hypothetical protein